MVYTRGGENMIKPEFMITSSARDILNNSIQEYKKKNPNYDVFSISVSGRGGVIMGTTTVYIVWKLISKKNM